jgi:hypothetical protein
MKLSFYPMTLTIFVHSQLPGFFYEGFWGVGFVTIFVATMLVPVLYYPIRALIGKEIPAVSIGLYFVCILISFILEYYLLSNMIYFFDATIAYILIGLLFLIFALFTYFPPRLQIFKDSIYKKFGDFKQPFD